MTLVNLLPWRQQRRAELKAQFFVVLGVMILLAVVIVWGINWQVRQEILVQSEKNDLVHTAQSSLEQDIATTTELEKQRAQLIGRLRIIQDLQGRRSIIVHQLDELVRIVPDGVYLTHFSKMDNRFELEGVSEANNRISRFMRNISHSIWFRNPVLSEVAVTDKKILSAASHFKLTVFENIPDQASLAAYAASISSANGS